jgi:hypothetical protein
MGPGRALILILMNAAPRQLIRLNNGVELPALGFGVFQTPPGNREASCLRRRHATRASPT